MSTGIQSIVKAEPEGRAGGGEGRGGEGLQGAPANAYQQVWESRNRRAPG